MTALRKYRIRITETGEERIVQAENVLDVSTKIKTDPELHAWVDGRGLRVDRIKDHDVHKEDTMNKVKRPYRIAFTGHRPTKIGGYNDKAPQRVAVKAAIEEALNRAIAKYGESRKIVVITGGALGVDQDAARVAYKLGLPFVVAVPCQGQDSKWPIESKKRYAKMLKLASEVIMVHDGPYNNTCLNDRNEWMVNHCDALVAVWDGSSGGTAHCVQYARKVGKPIVRINPTDLNKEVQ